MYAVSEGNLEKVERFLIRKVKELGTRDLELRVDEVAFGADVALATAHRALKTLAQQGVIKIKKAKSRRYPNVYQFLADVDYEEKKLDISDEKRLLEAKVKYLMEELNRSRAEIARLRHRLYGA